MNVILDTSDVDSDYRLAMIIYSDDATANNYNDANIAVVNIDNVNTANTDNNDDTATVNFDNTYRSAVECYIS